MLIFCKFYFKVKWLNSFSVHLNINYLIICKNKLIIFILIIRINENNLVENWVMEKGYAYYHLITTQIKILNFSYNI